MMEVEIKPSVISDSVCSDYFSSLSILSRKIIVEQEVLCSMHAWDDMTLPEREKMLDSYFIHLNVDKKLNDEESQEAEDDKKDKVSYFPRYSVKSGEKIVVDFESGVSLNECSSSSS